METVSFYLAKWLASLLYASLKTNHSKICLSSSGAYSPIATDRSHKRIIWDCAWIVEKNEIGFATASRDKTVCTFNLFLPSIDYRSNFVTYRSKYGSLQKNRFPSGQLCLL